MPRIFVPGPSANPSLIGSPTQYLQNINQISAGRDRRRIADERTQNDRLFKEQTAALNERKQLFTEGAPERAEALRVANLARDNEKTTTVQNLAEGAQFVGGDRFDTIRGELNKDPRFANLDEAGQLAAQNQFILNNPSALTPPKQFSETLRAGLVQSGQFTGAEIEAHIAQQVAQRYPTADKDIIKSLLLKPKDLIGSGGNTNIFGAKGSLKSGSSNFDFVSDPTNPNARGDVVDRITDTFGLEKNPDTIFGQRLDVGDLDATKQDVAQGVGFLSSNGINSPTAQEAAFNGAFNDDGTVKDKFNWTTKAGRKALLAEATKAQNTEERLFDKKGGGISAAGQAAGVISPADAANAAFANNEKLLSRLTPQALSDSGVAEAFLNNLGPAPQNNTRQGGSGNGGVISPGAQQVVPPVITPSAQATADPQSPAPAEFSIGGQVPGEVVRDRIFDLIQGAIPPAPHDILADGITGAADFAQNTVAPAANQLFESLTPPGPGVLDPRSAAPEITSTDLRSIPPGQRPALQAKAQEAWKNGDISLDDAPGGGTIQEKILIAYLRSLEGSRN